MGICVVAVVIVGICVVAVGIGICVVGVFGSSSLLYKLIVRLCTSFNASGESCNKNEDTITKIMGEVRMSVAH